MPTPIYAVEAFEPTELHMLGQVYRDAWHQLAPLATDPVAEAVTKEAVAVALFDMARAGKRDPELLWCCAMREGTRAAALAHA